MDRSIRGPDELTLWMAILDSQLATRRGGRPKEVFHYLDRVIALVERNCCAKYQDSSTFPYALCRACMS
jgi:hypothetical protein